MSRPSDLKAAVCFVRRTLAAISAAAGTVACGTAPASQPPTPVGTAPWLWGGLEAGPFAVGLETIAGVDSARSERAADGALTPRPLELLVWYPSRAAGLTRSSVTFADYVDLSEGSLVAAPAGRASEWRRQWLAEAISPYPSSVDRGALDRVLSSPMTAARDVRPIGERSPVVLWSTRHATPAAQSVMSELLASHGYVVAWMRYAGRDSLPPPYDDVSAARKAEVVEAHVADLQWAIRRLVDHPVVDSTRMAVAAWSYAGEPATLLAQRTPRLRALVSLSSSVFTWPYRPSLNVGASLDSIPLRTDVLVFEESGAARGSVREAPPFLDRLPGKVFRVTFAPLAHGNFNVLEGLIPELIGVADVQPWSQSGSEAIGGYQRISRSVLALLDKVLKGAPGDGAMRTTASVRHAGTGVAFVRHGPGRAVSAVAGTSFVDDSVVIGSDGWTLVGNLVRSANGARSPAVLMLNKANGDRRVYASLARELAQRGVASLRLDLRGHGESTNLGTFVPGLANAASRGEERDVLAALRWLSTSEFVDPARLGVIGASYSAEVMAVAERAGLGALSYVALSPGSLSDRTIGDIDSTGIPWSIIVSRNERFLRSVVAAVRQRSRSAAVTELDGAAHATDILFAHPEINVAIADWLLARLAR